MLLNVAVEESVVEGRYDEVNVVEGRCAEKRVSVPKKKVKGNCFCGRQELKKSCRERPAPNAGPRSQEVLLRLTSPGLKLTRRRACCRLSFFLNFFLGIEAEFRVVTFLCGMKKCVVVARGEGGVRGAGTRADKPWQRHERYTRLETSASGDPSHWLYTEEVQRLRWSL